MWSIQPPNYLCLYSQALVSFEDVAVTFTVEEWGQLDLAQRALYQEVIMETRGLLVSLGKDPFLFWVQNLRLPSLHPISALLVEVTTYVPAASAYCDMTASCSVSQYLQQGSYCQSGSQMSLFHVPTEGLSEMASQPSQQGPPGWGSLGG